MRTTPYEALGKLCVSRPRWVLALIAVLVVGVVPLVLFLPLESDIRDTLPDAMAQAMERRNALFGNADLALLLVQGAPGRKNDLLAFGQAVQQRLANSPLVRSVAFGYAPALLAALDDVTLDYAPLFVRPEDLDDFDRLLTPQGMQAQIRKTILNLSLMGSGIQDSLLADDPLQLRRFVFARLAAMRGAFRFDTLSPYFLSPDGTALLIKIEGQVSVHDMASAKAMVTLLQTTRDDLLAQPDFQGLTVQATGGYFFAAESERIIRRDIIVSVSLAVLAICVLITWALRRWGVLVYGPLPTLLGLLLALGVFALLRPQLNALTLGCVASLVGFGVDYTIHILRYCFVAQGHGKSTSEAVRLAVRDTGGGLVTAALTAMAAFTAFLFAKQDFLRDMGLLAALGVFWCVLLSLTFLPALLTALPQKPGMPPPRTMGLPRFVTTVLRIPRMILGLSLLCSLGALAALVLWPPGFETDLRNIHARRSPVLQAQEDIAARFGGSQEPLTLMIEGATEEQVLHDLQRLEPALTALVSEGLLAAVTSPGMLYPPPALQAEVLQRLQAKDPQALADVLTASLAEAGFDVPALQGYITRIRQALAHRQPLDLASFRALGFDELLRSLLAHDAAGAVGVAVLFPTHDLWTRAARETVTQRIMTVLAAHDVHGVLSGLYTISSASAAQIGGDFQRITLVATLAILLIVSLRFRRPALIGLVLLPVGCGTLWTAGLFAWWGFTLNFMNIAILPMLLGIGIDYGIYIVHRFQTQETPNVYDAVQGTGAAISLSALTTLVAFGTLALSRNQGIASVGIISLVGITACLVAALCTLPAALQVYIIRREQL